MGKNDKIKIKELTAKEKLFCLEYLKDFNATQAATRAGYSEKSAKEIGYENLTKPHIQFHLYTVMQKVFSKAEDKVTKIIQELELIAFSDIADVIDWDQSVTHTNWETGAKTKKRAINLKSKKELGEKSRFISEISESETMYDIKRKVKLYDKLKAIELLGKYHKIFADRVEHSNPDGTLKPLVQIFIPDNGRDKNE